MANIVLLGNQGSGKTVFISVFSHKKGWEPCNDETDKYIYGVCEQLYDDYSWPESTRKATALSWTFKLLDSPGAPRHSFVTSDVSGQDFDQLYGEKDNGKNPAIKSLREAVNSADVIMLLVNLQALIDEKMRARKKKVGSILKCLREERDKGKTLAIIYTQWDRIEAYLEAENTTEKDMIENLAPELYRFTKEEERDGCLTVLKVAAVAETEIRDGKECPKKNFKSKGLDKIGSWLEKTVGDTSTKKQIQALEKEKQKIKDSSDKEIMEEINWKELEDVDFNVSAEGNGGFLGRDDISVRNESLETWEKIKIRFRAGGERRRVSRDLHIEPSEEKTIEKVSSETMFHEDALEDVHVWVKTSEDIEEFRRQKILEIEEKIRSLKQ